MFKNKLLPFFILSTLLCFSPLFTDEEKSSEIFLLAQSLVKSQEYELALKYYEQRALMGGNPEETFLSLYLSGKLKEVLKKPFDEVVKSYTAAYQQNPNQAEPLYYLGKAFLQNENPVMAYTLFKLAASTPALLEPEVHKYAALFELARSACLINQEEEALKIFETLRSNPFLKEENQIILEKNISHLISQKLNKTPLQKTSYQIENYLKKIQNKTSSTKLRNIDFIYLINLDKRPEKWERCLNQLSSYGIQPYRFSALNGWELSSKDLYQLGVQLTPEMRGNRGVSYFLQEEKNLKQKHVLLQDNCHSLVCFHSWITPGAIGCTLSHLSILQDAYDANYEAIWILEDDILVEKDPHQLSEIIDRLDLSVGKENWDVLYTDDDKGMRPIYKDGGDFLDDIVGKTPWAPNISPSKFNKLIVRESVNQEFMKIGSRYKTHSMIIRRSGIKKILDYKKKVPIFNGYDIEIALTSDIQMYMLRYDVVTCIENSVSDTANNHFK